MSTWHDKEERVLKAIFHRKGKSGEYTRLFEEHLPVTQRKLLDLVELAPNEIPVVATVFNGENWSMITTERVLWAFSNHPVNQLTRAEISHVALDLDYNIAQGLKKKNNMRYLKIKAKQDKEYRIEAESGNPLIGVWNVLKRLATIKKPEDTFHAE